MQEHEIATQQVGQSFADLDVVHIRDFNPSLIWIQRSVKVVFSLHGLDRVEHGDVGDEAVFVAQESVQSGQKCIEFVQLAFV